MNKKRLQKLAGILQEQERGSDPWGVAKPTASTLATHIIDSMVQFYYDELGSEWGNHREFLAKSMGQNWEYFDEQWDEFANYLQDLVKARVVAELPQQLKKERRAEVAHKRQRRD